MQTARHRSSAPYQPTADEREALRETERFASANLTLKRSLERQWRLNEAFLVGHHYSSVDGSGNIFRRMDRAGRFKSYDNRNFVRPYLERRVASFVGFTPRFLVRPQTSDIANKRAADLGKGVLAHYWNHLNMPLVWQEAMYWSGVTGNGFLQVLWDEEEGEAFSDEMGRYHDGDLRVEAVPPYQIDLDPLASRWTDVRRVRKSTRRTLDWVEERFGAKARFVKGGEGLHDDRRHDEDALLDLTGTGGYVGTSISESMSEDWAIVDEYWFAPSNNFPNGRLILRSGSVILRDGDSPSPKGKLPFIHLPDMPVPGRVWGQSIIDCMIPAQKNYLRMVNRTVENIVYAGSMKIISPAGSGMQESAFTTDVAEVWEYAGVQPPQFMAPPPMPPDIQNFMLQARNDLDLMTSQFGPSRGQYQGRTSGKALDLLIEQDAMDKEPALQRHARGLELFGNLVLEVVQERVDDERAIKISGKRKQFDVKFFRGADLAGNTDVTVEVGSMRHKSMAQAISMVQALTPLGWLQPQNAEHQMRVNEALGWEDEQELVRSKGVHVRAAELENEFLKMGRPVEPAQWYEDQDIHMAVHTEEMSTDEFKLLPPQIKAVFQQHVASHAEIITPRAGVTVTPDQMVAEGEPSEPAMAGGN